MKIINMQREEEFKLKALGDYHDLYVETDTLLLRYNHTELDRHIDYKHNKLSYKHIELHPDYYLSELK